MTPEECKRAAEERARRRAVVDSYKAPFAQTSQDPMEWVYKPREIHTDRFWTPDQKAGFTHLQVSSDSSPTEIFLELAGPVLDWILKETNRHIEKRY